MVGIFRRKKVYEYVYVYPQMLDVEQKRFLSSSNYSEEVITGGRKKETETVI